MNKKLSGLLGASLMLVASTVLAETPSRSSSSSDRSDSPRARMGDESARQENRRENREILENSASVYRALVKDREGRQIPENVTSKARCVAVFPNTITAALVVGGSHGRGVASCRNNGSWSAPAFVNLNAGSLGAQIGGKSSDIVLFLTNKQAEDAFKRGKFTVGADASVAAGTYQKSFDTGSKGVIAYERTEGAFAGASINAGTITKDNDSNRSYYGGTSDFSRLIEGRADTQLSGPEREFISLLPS